MSFTKKLRNGVCVASVCAIAACHGASPGLPPPAGGLAAPGALAAPDSRAPRAGPTAVVMLSVPVGKALAWRSHSSKQNPFFTALGTKGVKIVVYPHGTTTGALATATANVAAGSSACTGTVARVCSVSIALPGAGRDDFVITSYNESPVGGAIPSGAHQLGAGVAVARVKATGTKSVGATLGGVVAGTSLFLTQGALHSIDTTSQQAVVVATDADGNAIVGSGYVDANGDKVTITMSSDGVGGTSVTFLPKKLGKPPANLQIKVNYHPSGATSAQIQTGFSTVLSATASNGATVGTAKLTLLAPQFTEFSTPTAGSVPAFMTVGSDGAIWFTEFQAGAVGRIPTDATTGAAITEFTIPTSASRPWGIASGSDGGIWFTEQTGNKIGHLPVNATSGASIAEVTIPTSGSEPYFIASGPDGALWFAEGLGNKVARIPTSATSSAQISEIALATAASEPTGVAAGSDGNIWLTELSGNKIARLPVTATTAAQITEVPLPTSAAEPYSIAPGRTGSMLTAERATNNVASIPDIATTSSQITEYAQLSAASDSYQAVLGPDGAIWYSESGAANKIGRIAPNGTITEYLVPTSGARTAGIITGPDGAIWFTECNEGKVGKLQ